MISYRPFFETLDKKNYSEYRLIFKEGFPSATLHRMKHNQAITTTTLDLLCTILQCEVSDIIEYVSENEI